MFYKIDERGLGKIPLTDLEKNLDDEAVKAFFESLEIGAVDAWTLFLSLDVDGDNLISIDEFMERCVQLRGPARSVDLYAIRRLNASRLAKLFLLPASSSSSMWCVTEFVRSAVSARLVRRLANAHV